MTSELPTKRVHRVTSATERLEMLKEYFLRVLAEEPHETIFNRAVLVSLEELRKNFISK